MSLDQWLPPNRQRNPQPATPPTVAQVRRRQRYSRTIVENARNETARRMADRLIATWQPDNLVAQALEDLNSSSSLLRQEAQRFLAICAPDKLPTVGEGN